jgi:chaperonin GroEL
MRRPAWTGGLKGLSADDMLYEDILDRAKVTRLALRDAASVAALLLTTEVMIAEAPKDDDHAHGGPPGGGMGGMGGMDN